MTGKLNKDILMILYATVLTVVALVYGFSSVPNPEKQRIASLDHRRVSDLGELQYSIQTYYTDHATLPASLEALSSNSYSPTTTLNKADPDTKQPYEYTVTGKTSYKLCATFTTDSTKDDPANSYDERNYNYSSFRDKFSHAIGHTCFPLTVIAYANPSNAKGEVNVITLPVGSASAQ